MKTAAEYLNKNKTIIPCEGKKPIPPEWQKRDFKLEDFKDGNNIGLKLKDDLDIDIDSQRALPFIFKYVQPSSAVFGRGNKPISHYLFKGQCKHKKFFLHKDLEKYYKHLPHEATIIECRSGEDKQTIMPGSIIEGEEVKWKIFEGISTYPGDVFEDVSMVAFATALSILYPDKGTRDDYTYAIACILAKNTDLTEIEIDDFIEYLAEHSGDPERRRGKGTHAYKQMTNGGKMKGFNTLREILGLDNAQSLYNIFEWIGVNPPDKNLEELKKKSVYILDSASVMDTETGIEKKKADFNDAHLFKFPGGKDKKSAFASLMTDPEFQERLVIGRAVLPGHDYPIAEIGPDHFHLKPGRYLNLYPGPPHDPVKGDVTPWVNSYKKIYGETDYDYIEQYFAALIQKMFKHKLTLTAAEDKEIGQLKIMWGYLIVGPEGTAKKGLMETLQRIIGKEYVDGNATYDQMIGSHSEVIYNKLFVCINEVVTTGDIAKKVEISNKLKPFWTDEDCKINPKHIRPFRYWNNCNGICFSNEKDCLHIGKGSRRYGVINQYNRLTLEMIEGMEQDGTFTNIYKFLETGGAKHLFHHFLYEVKVKNWKLFRGGRAPKTDATQQMIDEGRHPVQMKLTRALQTKLAPFDDRFPGFVILDDLLEYIKEKWHINVHEKYVKDWIKEVEIPWKDGKSTRQIVLEETGSRPRAHKLTANTFLDEMTQGELGSAPKFNTWEWKENKLKHSLKNSFEFDVSGHESSPETRKKEVVERFMEIFFGMKWSNLHFEKFLTDCLKSLQSGKKKWSTIIYNNTNKESKEVNWEQVWIDSAAAKKETRDNIEEAKEEFIASQPSAILYDPNDPKDQPIKEPRKRTINL